jgi:hypothetical protein
MTSLPSRLVIGLTAFLTLAIVAILGLRAIGLQVAVGPAASPTPMVASPTPGQPTASPSGDVVKVFARIENQVSALRGLAQPDIGPPDVINRNQLADELDALLDEDWTPAQLADDNLTLRAMGLLTEQQDIRELTERLLAGQVLGFYDFEDRRMVVVTDAGLTPGARITYAHEFTHAMQDEAFDTGETHGAQAEDDDAAMAFLALQEGDATVSMIQWAFQNLTPEELAEVGATPVPDTSGVPQWMIRQLEFPYLTGSTWVTQLWSSGGWEAVDAAYADPPASTEQVMHPEKYRSGERPLAVADPDLANRMGAGWRDVESSTLGEAMLGIWLAALGVGEGAAQSAAAGWGGDRLTVSFGPDGEWALALRIAWDAASEANGFDDAHALISADLPFATAMRSTGRSERLILHASSPATMDTLKAALGR